jgi:hypothetical protein
MGLDKETTDAAARVQKALEGLPPCNTLVAAGRDKDRNVVYGWHTPLAKVRRQDVYLLVRAAGDAETEVAKAQLKGCQPPPGIDRWPDGDECLVQTQCLWHLLENSAGITPPKPTSPTSVAVQAPVPPEEAPKAA